LGGLVGWPASMSYSEITKGYSSKKF